MSLASSALALLAAGWASSDPRLEPGRELFAAACAACHGADGRGNPLWESASRPPDLADCATTAERADHWEAIVSKGGAAYGLASVMPSFAEAFTRDEVGAVVAYTRTLCAHADRHPPGELSARRLLGTAKAFPETELRIEGWHALDGSARSLLGFEIENRLGPRLEYHVALPMRPRDSIYDEFAGVGNLELGVQQVLGFWPARGLIASAGAAVEAPTGSRPRNLSTGTWVWKPGAAIALARSRTFLQAHLVAELPASPSRQDRQVLYGVGVSRALGLPRCAWTPAVEILGARNPRRQFWRHELSLEISRPLTRLGHVVAAAGVRFPLGRYRAPTRFESSLSWDFSEGRPWRGF
jgi:mono/diheme cytochrome c family protein